MNSTRLEQNVEVWDSKVAPFSLPPKFDLILADIDAGSHTPTLVGKVLNWRKENPEKGTFRINRQTPNEYQPISI
jgi:phosphomevalonate kinase